MTTDKNSVEGVYETLRDKSVSKTEKLQALYSLYTLGHSNGYRSGATEAEWRRLNSGDLRLVDTQMIENYHADIDLVWGMRMFLFPGAEVKWPSHAIEVAFRLPGDPKIYRAWENRVEEPSGHVFGGASALTQNLVYMITDENYRREIAKEASGLQDEDIIRWIDKIRSSQTGEPK